MDYSETLAKFGTQNTGRKKTHIKITGTPPNAKEQCDNIGIIPKLNHRNSSSSNKIDTFKPVLKGTSI